MRRVGVHQRHATGSRLSGNGDQDVQFSGFAASPILIRSWCLASAGAHAGQL